MLKAGPFGSRSGEVFDDGPHSTVIQLVINHSEYAIHAIKIEYHDHNGSSFWSELHGEVYSDAKTDTIKLDYPEEFLTSVHAHYFKLWRFPGNIISIAFNSNKKSYGPYGTVYGKSWGQYFSIKAPGSKIVGFHGNASFRQGLRAIGAYLKPYDDDPSRGLDHSSSSMIKLDYPDEFLISVHGYYMEKTWLTTAFIDSLTFKSNKKTYGPYGTERGKHFSIEVPGSKIVGFHGWTGNYTTALRAMGVHLKPIDHHQNDKCHPSKPLYHIDLHNQHSAGVYSSSQVSFNSKMSCEKSNGKMPRKVGPFGAHGGGIIFDDGVHSAVKQLVITYDHSYINFIHIKYDDNGSSNWSNTHGYQMPEQKKDTIKLDYPDEFLTSVYGCYSNLWSLPTYISSLTFKSNKKSYGPYGEGGGQHFSIERPGYKIVGFHGRTDLLSTILIRAIGAYLKPINHLQNDKCHPSKPLYHVGSSVVPTVRDSSKLLLPPEYPCHPKVISEDNDKANTQISCIISGNQVSGNEGNHNGTYTVANKYKYITYYIGNSNGM